jgi:hypothetical protein
LRGRFTGRFRHSHVSDRERKFGDKAATYLLVKLSLG